MHLRQNVSLKTYNTFGIDALSEYFIELSDASDLAQLTQENTFPRQRHIIGGGSNILLTGPVRGLTILNRTRGIRLIKEDSEYTWLEVQSGENWHNFVMYAISNNWAGVENLALIPGTVGAAPMQNIGAYGAEAREVIETVNCWHWSEAAGISYSNEQCKFGYRDSIFKQELKSKVFITSVIFRLSKTPRLNLSYGTIVQQMEEMNIATPTIKSVADAVISIRRSKLPDPAEIGNAGSFFKNPTISKSHFETLQHSFPSIPFYVIDSDRVKIPAGWLIEQCGWKGYREKDYGVHQKQALVLVNYGEATGLDIWNLSERVLQSVKEQFGIALEREVQVW